MVKLFYVSSSREPPFWHCHTKYSLTSTWHRSCSIMPTVDKWAFNIKFNDILLVWKHKFILILAIFYSNPLCQWVRCAEQKDVPVCVCELAELRWKLTLTLPRPRLWGVTFSHTQSLSGTVSGPAQHSALFPLYTASAGRSAQGISHVLQRPLK